MGLFSSKPANRRRRCKTKTEHSWVDEAPKPRAARERKAKNSKEQTHQLHAQIGAIESFLAKHHQSEVQRIQMRSENILPPPDRSRHRQARKTVTMAARRRQLEERNRTSFKFIVLFCAACGLSWWLIFAGV